MSISQSNGIPLSNGSNATNESNQIELKDLRSLRNTITLTLSEVMITVKPSQSFLDWMSSTPMLSVRDIILMENFYEDKSTCLILPKLPQKSQRKYDEYMEAFKEQQEVILLDQYFVDETCIHFLLYRNGKIQDCEIMLE